jgi:hypothetical protein
MDHPRTAERIWNSTNEFRALRLDVQPVFVLRDSIGDKAILSGLFETATLLRCADEMLAAVDGYASYGAANPEPLEVPK